MRQPPYFDGAPDVLHDLLDEAWRDGALRLAPASLSIGRSIGMPDYFLVQFDCLVEGHREDREVATVFHWQPKENAPVWAKRKRRQHLPFEGWESYK